MVEDCVKAVGVDLNTDSIPLLTKVSGLNKTLATNIVEFRDQNGSFTNRKELKKVERLGPKAFEQCAGFLKIANGDNPLDASSVHPEAYPVVTKNIEQTSKAVNDVLGNGEFISKLDAKAFIDEKFGLPTVQDILQELDKPGRDPRPEFKTAEFKDGVETLSDLKPNMMLEGVITNVTNFGAFVDIGVHQDGLVHISSLTDKFVSSPSEVVKAGDIVKVKVLEVDIPRKRISLTMRLDEQAKPKSPDQNAGRNTSKGATKASGRKEFKGKKGGQSGGGNSNANNAAMGNAFAEAFAKAKK